MKSLAEIFAKNDDSEELYKSDQYYRRKRGQRGIYAKAGNTFDFIHLVKSWEEIVGAMLAQNTMPLRIKNSQLYILTKHAVFSQELSFMDQLIIKKIETIFPSYIGKIKKIRFSTGNFSSDEFNNIKSQRPGGTKQLEVENLTKKKDHPFDPKFRQKKLRAESMFSDIDDPEIKQLLVNIVLID